MTNTATDKTTTNRPDWLPEAVWPFQIRTATIDGTTIAYTDEGEGPVLLLVHDGMWSYIWGQLIEQLRDDFRLITLDFPGSGLSPDSDYELGLAADSEILEALVDHLDLDELTLVVHDLGGNVGLGMASRRPDLVTGLVMINTFAWPPHVKSLSTMFKIMGGRLVTGIDVTTNLIPRLTSGSFGVGRLLDKTGRRAFVGPFRDRGPRRRFHELFRSAMTERPYVEEVERGLETTLASKPVLTIYGERNDPFGFQARFRDYFPDAEEMVIPGGNHFPMSDDPEAVAGRIVDWHRRNVAE